MLSRVHDLSHLEQVRRTWPPKEVGRWCLWPHGPWTHQTPSLTDSSAQHRSGPKQHRRTGVTRFFRMGEIGRPRRRKKGHLPWSTGVGVGTTKFGQERIPFGFHAFLTKPKPPFVVTDWRPFSGAKSLLKFIWSFPTPLLGQLATKGAATHLLNTRRLVCWICFHAPALDSGCCLPRCSTWSLFSPRFMRNQTDMSAASGQAEGVHSIIQPFTLSD